MAYVETDNIKFVLTNHGKIEGLNRGFLNVMKYFTVEDSGLIYTLNVLPNKFLDVNGSHETSTNVSVCDNNNIIE